VGSAVSVTSALSGRFEMKGFLSTGSVGPVQARFSVPSTPSTLRSGRLKRR
jgi:hypothetical protein